MTALGKANNESKTDYEREHVTPYLYNTDLFSVYNHQNEVDLSNERWTLDEQEDFILIKDILLDSFSIK